MPHRLPVGTFSRTRRQPLGFIMDNAAGVLNPTSDETEPMYARHAKESHRDTISYEIDMLTFCAEKLAGQNRTGDDGDSALLVEGFLLHFRNLVRVFSGKNHQKDDISMANCRVWAGRDLTAFEAAAIKDSAIALDDMYYKMISKYLQHCTTRRYEQDRTWDIHMMRSQLNAIVQAFEEAFPR